MRITNDDIWRYLDSHRVVVTTNLGWAKSGANPMGRGVALQAAQRFPKLPMLYGEVCRRYRESTPVIEFGIVEGEPEVRLDMTKPSLIAKRGLILFPTKPFNKAAPQFSWKGDASIDLIERGAKQLAAGWKDVPVALPLVGCANGGLRDTDVIPILEKHLVGDNFLLVLR